MLRYVVTATPRAVSAKLAAVPASSPMGALEGTRNLIAFTTRRYSREPLVVSGPGAGPAVTAAGILNDIYSLAGAMSSVNPNPKSKSRPLQIPVQGFEAGAEFSRCTGIWR